MEDTGNTPPRRAWLHFDPELAAGEGLWVLTWDDPKLATSHHGAREAALRWAELTAETYGFPVEVEPE